MTSASVFFAVSRQKERGLPAVILAELSRPAFGGTTEFGGNPEERSQPPWGMYTTRWFVAPRHSRACPLTG